MKVKLLSITLRDAQHLSWKTYKKFESLNEELGRGIASETELVKKTEEIAGRLKSKKDIDTPQSRDELARMFSKLLFSVFVLSERCGVSLEDSFLQAVDEFIMELVT
jgi:hypothetical protein